MQKEVALVLSSGGARGVAQIGVIKALEKSNLKIHSIAGSSMGAVVGGIYAAGYLDNYSRWLCTLDRLDVFNLMDFTFSSHGLIKGERVFKELEKLLPDGPIENLPIHFRAIATDITNKKEYVFEEGSLFEALRASVAIPTVLKPSYKDGVLLVDGGVINPLPIDRVKRKENDLLIVVNTNAHIPYDKPKKETVEEVKKEIEYQNKLESLKRRISELLPRQQETQEKKLGFFDLLTESIDLMQDKMCNMLMKDHRPDILVNISKDSAGTFEYYRSERLIKEGREAFQKTYENFKKETELGS